MNGENGIADGEMGVEDEKKGAPDGVKETSERVTNKERGRRGRGQTEKDIEEGEGMSM